jgi:hypothetical protein
MDQKQIVSIELTLTFFICEFRKIDQHICVSSMSAKDKTQNSNQKVGCAKRSQRTRDIFSILGSSIGSSFLYLFSTMKIQYN